MMDSPYFGPIQYTCINIGDDGNEHYTTNVVMGSTSLIKNHFFKNGYLYVSFRHIQQNKIFVYETNKMPINK